MTTLVVSPHLDDAVLSIPGWLAATRERTIVLTVFTEGDAEHPRRRAEDLAALTILGLEPAHLGLRDAPERRGLPRTFPALILGDLDDHDPDAAAVQRALTDFITRVAPTTVLLPLGVGEHIDHRIVHAVHPRLTPRVGFYEDRPYALIRHAVRARLARIGALEPHPTCPMDQVVEIRPPLTRIGAGEHHPAPPAQAAAEFLASARRTPHILALIPPDQREACLAPLAAMLTASPLPTRLHLRRELFTFEDPALLAAAAAVRAYASQLPALLGAADPTPRLFQSPYTEHIHWRR